MNETVESREQLVERLLEKERQLVKRRLTTMEERNKVPHTDGCNIAFLAWQEEMRSCPWPWHAPKKPPKGSEGH